MRMNDATALTTRLPETLAALEAGTIPYTAARTIAQATGPLDAVDAATVQDRVLARAATQTPAEFARTVRRTVAGIDPRGAKDRHEHAASERRVVHRPEPDAMAWLHAYLPAVDAAAIMTGVQAAADAAAHDGTDRTADQRRADALVDLCLRGAGYGDGGVGAGGHADGGPGSSATGASTQQGRKPSVQVSVALSTLLGLDEQPGDLDGYGPIPAELARRLAADPSGTWRRLLTDDHGRLLDYGRTTYRPPADLRDYVIARDRTCTLPVCHRDARRCDLDHLTDWAAGGTTSPGNLGAKCPRHHYLEARGRLAHRTPPGRHHPLDHSLGPHPRRSTGDISDRHHHSAAPAARTATGSAGRAGPAAVLT
jgi:hypothetical protein